MAKIVGITGGIASGKSTIVNFLRKNKKPIHDSDQVVKACYLKPSKEFINYLKKIKLGSAVKNKKIITKIIRDEIFNNKKKKKLLEEYLHNKVRISRNKFIKKHRKIKTKIIFLDIPLLFEKKLKKICDYTVFLYTPEKIRKKRALRRKGMTKSILEKILKSQLNDREKIKKSDFVIKTFISKNKSFTNLKKIIEKIKAEEK